MVPTPRHKSQITILQTVVFTSTIFWSKSSILSCISVEYQFKFVHGKYYYIIIKSLLKTSEKGFQQMLMELWNYHYQKFEHMINY